MQAVEVSLFSLPRLCEVGEGCSGKWELANGIEAFTRAKLILWIRRLSEREESH